MTYFRFQNNTYKKLKWVNSNLEFNNYNTKCKIVKNIKI